MSEFKFACPVCGQRMAVDSSATGAQVECPTCFQIIIVPKAPVTGSKYQLSATQYIKPIVLPPKPKPAAPVAPQRQYAVLIFALILVCAVVTALLIREQIVSSQREQAKKESANAIPPVVSPFWTLDLTNAVFPDRTAEGEIHGKDFTCRQAVLLQNGVLALRSERGWQAMISANVFVSTNGFSWNAARILSGQSFEVGTNYAGFAPSVTLSWREGDMRVIETFTNNFALKLEFGILSSDQLPGKIYLCLPDAMKSYVAGSFTAEVPRFPPRRAP
jgi:hypothetical protein